MADTHIAPCVLCGKLTEDCLLALDEDSPHKAANVCFEHLRELADFREAERAPTLDVRVWPCQRYGIGPGPDADPVTPDILLERWGACLPHAAKRFARGINAWGNEPF